jgi:hypothetical protein
VSATVSEPQATCLHSDLMEPLPADFAKMLVQVLAPGDEGGAAEVIQAAIRLDDARLETFLARVAERVRASDRLITHEELRRLLRAAAKGESAAGS